MNKDMPLALPTRLALAILIMSVTFLVVYCSAAPSKGPQELTKADERQGKCTVIAREGTCVLMRCDIPGDLNYIYWSMCNSGSATVALTR